MEQTQTLRIIQQSADVITVAQGEVPVIPYFGDDVDVSRVAMIVNFLRAGSPAAQIIVKTVRSSSRSWVVREMRGLLGQIRRDGEEFILEDSPGDVWTVTRSQS